MNDLTKWVINELAPTNSKIKTIVAIYPGRFQPMGAHHAKTYKWLAKQFGEKNTFVGTSDKVSLPKSPFNYNEKKKIINSHGITNVVKVKNPYKAEEILSKYDPDTTAVVFMVGQKDAGRLTGKYFKPWKGKAQVGYKDGGYLIMAPHVSMSVPGFGEMSGTQIRKALGSNTPNKEKIFKGIFGHTKKNIYDLIVGRLEKLNGVMEAFIKTKDINTILNEQSNTITLSGSEVDDGPRYFYGSKHAYETTSREMATRLGYEVVDWILSDVETLDFRNPYPKGPVPANSYYPSGVAGQTTPSNQLDWKGSKAYNAWKKHITRVAGRLGMEFVNWLGTENSKSLKLKEPNTISKDKTPNIEESFSKEYFTKIFEGFDLPIEIGDTVYMGKWKNKKVVIKTIEWNDKGDLLINGTSAMRMRIPNKSNVFGDDPRYKDKETNELLSNGLYENLLLEGGAYGHMAHPFDDSNLRFADIKKMIDLGLQGKLDLESSVTEKTDGQNLMVTWKDNKLKAARNKTTLKEPLDINAVKKMFAGRGDIEKAFVYAMHDLENAISKLSDKQKEKIFKGGRAFMNLEIIYPATENVIVYDSAVLQFHGALEYDENANVIGPVKNSASMLQGMIAQVNADVQKHFKIIKPQVLSIKPHNDYTKKRDFFFGKLKKLQKEFNLKDSDTLGMYHQMWWESFIRKQATKTNYVIPTSVVQGLVKRWAFFDKKYAVRHMKSEIKDTKFLEWAQKFDKVSHAGQVKKNMYPFETLIFEVGHEILDNVENYLTASPDKAIQKMKDEIHQVSNDIAKGGDVAKLKKLKQQLKKIQAAGGLDKIVPSEGLVFVYGGKTYKITGKFGPINQILGTLKFG